MYAVVWSVSIGGEEDDGGKILRFDQDVNSFFVTQAVSVPFEKNQKARHRSLIVLGSWPQHEIVHRLWIRTNHP